LSSLYAKNRNRDVAKHMTIEDIEGTDLLAALRAVVAAAERLQEGD
jgi:hypothetical protein